MSSCKTLPLWAWKAASVSQRRSGRNLGAWQLALKQRWDVWWWKLRCPTFELPIHRGDFFCSEACRQDDFKHLDVVAVAEFAMTNVRRLMDT